ncbi:hypothetical protein, partial [[Clostridium] symbiosum]|uniref:hypothetical protein n=1 Tax=Clostridium symbiosum TaxID=1512 RepID=UPI0025A361CC
SRQPSTRDGKLSHPPHHTGHGPFRSRLNCYVKSPERMKSAPRGLKHGKNLFDKSADSHTCELIRPS